MLKARSPISLIFDGMVTLSKLQFINAASPIALTFGSETPSLYTDTGRAVHPLNPVSVVSLLSFGQLTLVRLLQSLNAHLPIVSRLAGKERDLTDIWLKASSPISESEVQTDRSRLLSAVQALKASFPILTSALDSFRAESDESP